MIAANLWFRMARRFGSSKLEYLTNLPENFEPWVPSIHDPPVSRKPGELMDVQHQERHWWSTPAIGFNAQPEICVHQLDFQSLVDETAETQGPEPLRTLELPAAIFGTKVRKDLIHQVYWFHRKALAGYQEEMQLAKYEWPGTNKKHRSQVGNGLSRMGRRKGPGRYEGSYAVPVQPKDWRIKCNRRVLWLALKSMLSAKFAQNEIVVVDSFKVASHKTKYLVGNLRRLLGRQCNSALLVHEGTRDVNDEFRAAEAHLTATRRENVEGVNVYKLLKYQQLVITEMALQKLIWQIETYPKKCDWLPKHATPDGRPAPRPKPVSGWNAAWLDRQHRLRTTEYRAKLMHQDFQSWKWSHQMKGPLKIPRSDVLAGFRSRFLSLYADEKPWSASELDYLHQDTEPVFQEAPPEFSREDAPPVVTDLLDPMDPADILKSRHIRDLS